MLGVLITGCSDGGLGDGGLGAAMAKAHLARGFRVFATLRNRAKIGSLQDLPGVDILKLETTSQESIDQCATAVEKLTGGSLDILVFAWAGIHESSKAATTRLCETLRLEMAPLGVRVVTVVLGGVATNGNDASKIEDLTRPETSYYEKIRGIIDRHKKASCRTGFSSH